mmetsp:Transcript_17285/g.50406  ORF Transcript_17285/g.50406 Transcript_17285/m.50406 type:complete len:326 (-) Transcript_17285:119-1096(-)
MTTQPPPSRDAGTQASLTPAPRSLLPAYRGLLLVDLGNLFPGPVQGLLPESDLVVSTGHGKKISRDRPADAPDWAVEGLFTQGRGTPLVVRAGPDDHSAVLRAACDHTAGHPRVRGPCHVTDPIRVALLELRGCPRAVSTLAPDAHLLVAGPSHKHHLSPVGVSISEPRGHGRPTDGVAAQPRTVIQGLQGPRVIRLVGQHRDPPIRRCAGEHQAKLVGRPGDAVHARLVRGLLVDLRPDPRGRLPVNEHTAVIGARRQKHAELGVAPGHLPDRAFVPIERGGQGVGLSVLVPDLDRPVRRRRREFPRVVVHLGVVNHVIVLRVE